MSGQARITSFDALREARSALQRFIQEASAALGEAEADAQRTLQWLRFDQVTYWQGQVRSRHEAVEMAKAEWRRKQLTSIQDSPTAVDERRAVDRAKALEAEAAARVQHVRRWLIQLEREHTLFKGSAQSLADVLARDLPAAIVRLDRMAASVQAYAAMAPTAAGAGAGGVGQTGEAAGGAPVLSGSQLSEAIAARYANLRRRAPGPATRAGLPAGVGEFVYRDHRVREPDGGLFGVLGQRPDPPRPTDKVVVESDAMDAAMVVLERSRDGVDGDSGWFIGSAVPGMVAGRVSAVTVEELCRLRPGLMELLGLPRGYLVVLVGSPGSGDGPVEIEAVLDAGDRLVVGGTGG